MRSFFLLKIIVLSFTISSTLHAAVNTDSLILALNKLKTQDTVAANLNLKIAKALVDKDPDKASQYAETAFSISNKLNYLYGVASSMSVRGYVAFYKGSQTDAITEFNRSIEFCRKNNLQKELASELGNLGLVNYFSSNYDASIKNCLEAVKIDLAIRDSVHLSTDYNTLGLAYMGKGTYPPALQALLKGMKIAEARKDSVQITKGYMQLGMLNSKLGNDTEAKRYFKMAYANHKRSNNVKGLISSLTNLGFLYAEKEQHDSALVYYFEALKMAKESNNLQSTATLCNNICNSYTNKGDFTNAMKYVTESIDIRKKLGSKAGVATSIHNMGAIYEKMKNYKKAFECYDECIKLAREIGSLELVNQTYQAICKLADQTGDSKKAYRYLTYAVNLNDTLFSKEQEKSMAEMNTKYETDKKEKEIELLNKDNELKKTEAKQKEAELKQQRFVTYGTAFGGIIILGFLIVAIRGYQQKKKANEIITEQKNTVELQKKEVEHQKELVEEKQKEIMDSINYAKRIQYTLLANAELMNANLPEHFVYFKPKDVVSGDFYWATKKDHLFYIAVCDSTGHGVPGAFMSLLNISFLNEAIIEKNILQPNEILNHVRQRLTVSMDGGRDGMDAILVCFDTLKNTISYSAANNEPILITNNSIVELEKDKMPVGKGDKTESFKLHIVKHDKDDCLYLYTDGYADQFGGPKGKKFKYKELNDMLLKNHAFPFSKQSELLDKAFMDWKGEMEQVDDVCIIGIKI